VKLTADVIRLFRNNLDCSQREFADRLKISPSLLCRIEKGSRNLTSEVEERLRETFAIDDLTVSVITVTQHVIKKQQEGRQDNNGVPAA
jgi:transcriptional regulator with XRE-family HTH domain